MNVRAALTLVGLLPCLPLVGTLAADPPAIPEKPIAVKKDLLFADDFEGTERSKLWHNVVPTFTFENGMLKGTQTRDRDIPAQDGKREIRAHAAVYGLNLPTKDSVVETRIRFAGATLMDVEFDDRSYTGSHYGHLCRAQVRLDRVVIIDEREGTQNQVLKAMRKDPDPAKQAEARRIQARHQASFPLPARIEPDRWYTLVVETAGDAMRVSLDGKPVAFFRSPGIGHPTKSKIELGVNGKDGYFDDIKVWNAEPAR
jgi:hypothetical protein